MVHLICFGACLLATAYHTVLYFYYRDKLLLQYVAYLSSMCLYIFIRSDVGDYVFGAALAEKIVEQYKEGLQIIYFTLYINFCAHATNVPSNKKSFVYKGWFLLSIILLIYAATTLILGSINIDLPNIFYSIVRLFIFAMTAVLLWRTFKTKITPFQLWILLGCIYFFVCGVLSFISNEQPDQRLVFDPTAWLQVGNFGEIIFFSSALGYRFKKINEERQNALKASIEEKAVVQQLLFEKEKTILQIKLDERNRISRDMHDELGSGLTKIAILSEVLKTHKIDIEKNINKISETARTLVDNLDEMVWALNAKNDTLDKLVGYIAEYAYQYMDGTAIECEINIGDYDGEKYISEESRRNIFMVVKEFLNNTLKHSEAKNICINFLQQVNVFSIELKDDGKGFEKANTNEMGNGIKNMQQRISDIGGKSTFSTSNKGVCLQMSFAN